MSKTRIALQAATTCRFCLSHQWTDDFYGINEGNLVGGSLSIKEALISSTKIDMNVRTLLKKRIS